MPEEKITANEIAKMKHKELALRVVKLQEAFDKKEAENKIIRQALDEANLVIEADLRSRKTHELLDLSNYTAEDIIDMKLTDIEKTLINVRMAKKDYTSVADQGGRKRRASLGDIFENTPWGKKQRGG